jgi:hypothetical protein
MKIDPKMFIKMYVVQITIVRKVDLYLINIGSRLLKSVFIPCLWSTNRNLTWSEVWKKAEKNLFIDTITYFQTKNSFVRNVLYVKDQ